MKLDRRSTPSGGEGECTPLKNGPAKAASQLLDGKLPWNELIEVVTSFIN